MSLQMNELAAFLKVHDNYAVLGHVNPDGDASGSCIALALALREMGKRAFVYLPGGLAETYRTFETTVEIISEAEPSYEPSFEPRFEPSFEPETGLAVDVSDMQRLGSGLAIYEKCTHRAVLDHHATNPGFGEVNMVDGEAAACGELALELIGELGVALNAEMAQWLYIALYTDSGQFGYSCTRARTLEAAAACVRAGADPDRISRELYRSRSEGKTRLLGMVLSGLEMNEEKSMCWARLTDGMLQRAGAKREDSEGLVNYLLEIRGVEFACLAEERGRGQTKISLRSRQWLDVAREVALPLGGGGHARAAGVTLEGEMEEALGRVLSVARQALENKAEQEKE